MTDAAACYDLLLAACRCTDGELRDAYRRLRELLEQNKAERHIRGGMATRRKYKGS